MGQLWSRCRRRPPEYDLGNRLTIYDMSSSYMSGHRLTISDMSSSYMSVPIIHDLSLSWRAPPVSDFLFTDRELQPLSGQEREDHFKRFIATLSFFLTKNVIADLTSYFEFSETEVDKLDSDDKEICTILREKNIISERSVTKLVSALRETNNDRVGRIVERLFIHFQNRGFVSSHTTGETEAYFQRFLKSLSFLLNKKVMKDLSCLFALSDADVDTFSNDSVTCFKILREVGIVSPDHITPLTLALRATSNEKIGEIVEDLFRLFQDGKFASRKEEDCFQRFLKSLSFLLNKKVMKDLSCLFALPDADVDTFSNDSVTCCKILREEGIVSPDYITPLTLALRASSNEKIGEIVEDLFRLFQDGKFDSPYASKEEEDYFKRFLKSLSFLLTKKVVKDLSCLFALSDADVDIFGNDSVTFCKILREVGIVSPDYVTPLTLALRKSSNEKIGEIVEDLFKLFQDGKFDSQCASKQEEDVFKRFLYCVSHLIPVPVEEEILSKFAYSDAEVQRINKDSRELITILRERGIINQMYTYHLHLTLCESNSNMALIKAIMKEFESLFQSGKFDSSNLCTEISDDNFETFIERLSLLINEDVKERLVGLLTLSDVEVGPARNDNLLFCRHLAQRGLVSPAYVTPLVTAIKEKPIRRIVENLFRQYQDGLLTHSTVSEDPQGEDFQQFLNVSSLLITEDMKQQLATFFNLSDIELERAKKANMSFCQVLAQRRIICPENVELFKVPLLEESKYMLVAGVEELFQLYQDGKLISSPTSEVIDDDDFDEFLDCLSLLISADVRLALASFFKFSPAALEAIGNDKKAFCIFLKEQRIIDRAYITPLKIALHKEKLLGVGQCAAIYFATYRRKIQSSKAAQQKSRGKTTYGENKEQSTNRLFENLVQEMRPAPDDVKPIQIASSKHEVQSITHRAEENTQSNTQSINDNDGNDDEAQDSEMEEGPSPEDVESNQITSSKNAVQSMMQHAEDNTQGITQSIDENVGNNDKVHNSETGERHILAEAVFSTDTDLKESVRTPREDAKGTEMTSNFEKAQNRHLSGTESCLQGDTVLLETRNLRPEQELQNINLEKVPLDTRRALVIDFSQQQNKMMVDAKHESENLEDGSFNTDVCSYLEASSTISNSGGIITVSDTGVELEIPKNAFHDGSKHQLIEVKILPRRLYDDPPNCFEDHSTVMVEILPNNLQLKRPIKLTLPHCLIIRETCTCEVKIFKSHHEQGQKPMWEDVSTHVQYNLSSAYCTIWLDSFCWVKYTINGKEVEAKKLFLYALGQRYTNNAERVTADIGYFPALPENHNMIFRTKLKKSFLGDMKTYIFLKQPELPLQIELLLTDPDNWKLLPMSSHSKTISYVDIEFSNECSYPFVFKRKGPSASYPTCVFCVSQGERPSEMCIDMEDGKIGTTSGQDAFENKPMFAIKNKEETFERTSLAVARGHEIAIWSHQERAMTIENQNMPSTSKSLCDSSLRVIESPASVSESVDSLSLASTSCYKLPSDSQNIPGIDSTIGVPSLHVEMKSKVDDVARAISKHWEQVARKLGLETHDVECIRTEHSSHLHKQVVSMLDRWIMIKGNKANVYGLIKALEKCGLQLPADKVRRIFQVS